MQSEVRVGVIGTSWWADLVHLPSIKSHPQAQLAAICGRNRERADEMAAKYGIPRVFTDYRDLIINAGPDAVVVATPDDLHHPVTMAALEAGLHVMCEKPLAMDAEQARAMYERAEAAGVKHGVFFTWPWTPHYRQFQGLLDSGYVGRCYDLSVRYIGGFGRDGQYQWRYDGEHANGVLGDLGSHAIHFARLYVGEIAKVSAHLGTFVVRPAAEGRPFRPANDAAALALEFENGAQGTIQVSGVAYLADHFQEQHIELHGDAGTLESVFYFQGVALQGARAGDEKFSDLMECGGEATEATDPFEVFRTQPVGDRLFIDAILEGKPFAPNFYDGWKAQQVIDAAIQSHRDGRWVAVG